VLLLRFFPKIDYPMIWEGIDKSGTRFFPFHFVLVEKETKARFEFTQWSKYDDRDWEESRKKFEWAKREMLKMQQR
jgi:hypothetical protein